MQVPFLLNEGGEPNPVAENEGFVPAESVTIRDQVAVIGRRWRIIAIFVVVGVAASALYLHGRSPHYVSHAQVRVSQATSNEFAPGSTPVAAAVSMPTEQKLATSPAVAALASAAMGTGITPQQALSHLSVTVPASTQLLDFAYSASRPDAAQAGADVFEQAYLANRRSTIAANVANLRTSLLATKKSLDAQHLALATKLNETTDPAKKFQLNADLTTLVPQLAANANALTNLDTVDPQAAVGQSASLPQHPSGAKSEIVIAAGLVAGLVLGLIAAFLFDASDDHIHGPNDLVEILGIPVLARVPVLRTAAWNRRHNLAVEAATHPKVAEAYRLLANRLIVTAAKDPISSVLIVSPAKGEGRSSVAANLSAMFVDLGFRVWLVSADLAPPQMHKLFAPDEVADLINVVPITSGAPTGAPSKELEFGVEHDPNGGHLTLMASTERPLPAGRLLNPLVLARQVSQNQDLVDITIIDAPALLEFADAVPLIPVVDGVIIVADAGLTRRSELSELADLLAGTEARVIGSVLNRDGSRAISRRARRAHRRSRHARTRPSTTRSREPDLSPTDVGWPGSQPTASQTAGGGGWDL
jgi:Mrp family chromosome partitioning ATPase/capsular polysaccharide biosynthesis protein